MTDYSELKRLAEAATPGPWLGEHDVYSENGQGERICKMATAEDSAFISAANSTAVLELIAENEALRKDAERYRWLRDDTSQGKADFCIVLCHWTMPELDRILEIEDADEQIDAAMAKEKASD